MLRSDAQDVHAGNSKGTEHNMHSITVDAIAKIEKELSPYDIVSMVFLLYDVPDTALQRLIVFERVSGDMQEKTLNLLYDWAQHAQNRLTWRYEFLEALVVCQLYNIIRKLGFDVTYIKQLYSPENNHKCYINTIKKALYKLCEHTTSHNLQKLKNTLTTYDVDTTDYYNCELVLLELMCKKFITIDNNCFGQSNGQIQVEKLAKIVQHFAELQQFANELRELQRKTAKDPKAGKPTSTKTKVDNSFENDDDDDSDVYLDQDDNDIMVASAFEDVFKCLNELKFEDTQFNTKALKSDTRRLDDGSYPIINPKRIGVCYILNQEEFHPSKESIDSNTRSMPLDKRDGTTRDKIVLEKTMTSLNFEVISHCNLDHKKMMEYIKNIVQYRVHHDDSMFMLCILSHGVRGHVYAADSVKVKIDDIQSLLDEGFQERRLNIPKIMILQACQVKIAEEPQFTLAADGPNESEAYHLKKLNFLIYWATAPELEAYRDVKHGSLFIQGLCYIIRKYAKYEHLYDIFTKVTDGVAKICTDLRKEQVPIFESTLRKKLYLQIPEKLN